MDKNPSRSQNAMEIYKYSNESTVISYVPWGYSTRYMQVSEREQFNQRSKWLTLALPKKYSVTQDIFFKKENMLDDVLLR